MEILSFNAGYFLGYTGTVTDYLTHPWNAVVGAADEQQRLDECRDLIQDIAPDAVLLQEVDTGSLRTGTDGQVQYLCDRCPDGYDAYASTKYANRVLARMPLLQHMANGLLYRQGTVQEHYLDSGIKSLVHELQVDGMSMFSVHNARFGAWARRRQLRELAAIIDDRDRPIVIGDFNAFTGMDETNVLTERAGLQVASPGDTFPSCDPSYPLDFAAYAPDLSVECRRLDQTISDHMPIHVTVTASGGA